MPTHCVHDSQATEKLTHLIAGLGPDNKVPVLRLATTDDLDRSARDQKAAEESFADWSARAEKWKLQLELIDIERTLDDRLILYVLNDRSAETTRLALLAAAGGFGVIHVQPVSAEGVVQAVVAAVAVHAARRRRRFPTRIPETRFPTTTSRG